MLSFLKSLFSSQDKPKGESDAKTTEEGLVEPSKKGPWIAVDLDGTLAEYSKWQGIEHIGKPIPLMKARVIEWLKAGHRIKIFTARASVEEGVDYVGKWLKENGFPELEVTNQKDFLMAEMWDDRAIQVLCNTGRPIIPPPGVVKPKVPLMKDEIPGRTFYMSTELVGDETSENRSQESR